jgi:hypothetical protein
MEQSMQEAKAKLAARYTNGTQIGGKGKSLTNPANLNLTRCIGTQRRTKKVVTSQNVEEDKKLKAAVKKFGRC